MKKLAVSVLILLVALALMGCAAKANDYVIKVDGTEGAQYGIVYCYYINDQPHSEKLEGTVPGEYELEAQSVSVEVVNKGGGAIKASLLENGEVVDEKEVAEEGKEVKLYSVPPR